jgi:hypothetical protein
VLLVVEQAVPLSKLLLLLLAHQSLLHLALEVMEVMVVLETPVLVVVAVLPL